MSLTAPRKTDYRLLIPFLVDVRMGFSYTGQVQEHLSMMDRCKGENDVHYQVNKDFTRSFLQVLTTSQKSLTI